MSRGKKLTKAERRRRKKLQDSDFDNLVQDTAARFSCSTEIANDFADQCQSRAEDLEFDIIFTRLANEIWQDKSEAPLLALCDDLLAEAQRHREVIIELGRRFRALAAEERHHHLDPPHALRPLIRQRLFPEPPPSPEST